MQNKDKVTTYGYEELPEGKTRDIFKEGPSPELEAHWAELDAAIERYPTLSPQQKGKLRKKYPDIICEVQCCECGRDY